MLLSLRCFLGDDQGDVAGKLDVLAHSLKYVRQKRLEEINKNWKLKPAAMPLDEQ